MKKDKDNEARIKELEKQVNSLKFAIGIFAGGLDKVSQIQANQTGVVEKLVEGNENHTKALKKLMQKTDETNSLVKRLLPRGGKKG